MRSQMTLARAVIAALGLFAGFALAEAQAASQNRGAQPRTPASCPDYTQYSRTPHAPFSSGPLALPLMRPSPECRTFHSSAVEARLLRRSDPAFRQLP